MTVTVVDDPLIDDADLSLNETGQIELASARIRAYCRWHIYPNVNQVLTLDGPGQKFLMLPSMYVTDVNAVTEDGVTRASTEYEWSQTGQLWKPSPWTGHFRGVVVDLDHGYEDLPEEIRDVCISVAKRLPAQLAGVTQQAAGAVSQSFGGLLSGQASLSASFTASEQMELDRYRIPSRP